MKLDPKKDTLMKLREVYESQYGFMPEVLNPSWYVLRIPAYSRLEKDMKVDFLLKSLEEQGFSGDCAILDDGDILICTHYCRIEVLLDSFGPFEATPLTGMPTPVRSAMS